MEKEFVPYQEALALKELGFDETCFAWHVSEAYGLEFGRVIKDDLLNDAVLAPTWGAAFKWFREKYKINGETPYLPNIDKYGIVASDMTIKPKDLSKTENFKRGSIVTKGYAQYSTQEEAELECLRKLINMVKNGN